MNLSDSEIVISIPVPPPIASRIAFRECHFGQATPPPELRSWNATGELPLRAAEPEVTGAWVLFLGVLLVGDIATAIMR